MARNNVLRVLIAEDHAIVRRCLGLAISRRQEFQVVGEAATAAEALAKAAELQPDLVVVDVSLPDQTGVGVARAIRSHNPNVRVLLLTSHSDDRAVIASVMAGALGYLAKEIRAQEIVAAMRRAGRGQPILDQVLAGQALARLQRLVAEAESIRLTPQEQQVLDLAARGHTNGEIAQRLEMDEAQVEQVVGQIVDKLESLHRARAAVFLEQRRALRSMN